MKRIRQRIIKQVIEQNHGRKVPPQKKRAGREKKGEVHKNKGNFQEERKGNIMPDVL